MADLTHILSTFEPIGLEEMQSVKLMNRLDTKYVTTLDWLEEVLHLAEKQYFAQEIDGERIAKYDTLYFDTRDLAMYTEHHNRRLVRQKVRIRRYIGSPSAQWQGSDLTFLEVKKKNNKSRTKKKRIAVKDQSALAYPTEEIQAFMRLRCRYTEDQLLPQVRTVFRRITLVNKAKTERLTIDMDLQWTNIQTHQTIGLPPLVIIELKRDGNSPSPMVAILQQLRIKPLKISKYCIGTVLTNPEVKHNRFKNKLRKLNKLIHTTHTHTL